LVLNKTTKKSGIGCARKLSEANWLSILEHLPNSSEVFHSHSSCYCQQGTSDIADVGLKLLLSLNTSMWHVSYSSYYDYTVSLNMQQTVLQNVFIQTWHTVKIKNESFSALAWHGLY